MKTCPEDGSRVHHPGKAGPASGRPRAPETVDDTTPEQPKPSSIFSGFWGLHLAGIGLILIVWVLAWVLGGD